MPTRHIGGRRVVFEHDEAGLVDGAAVDGEETAHAKTLNLLAVHDGACDVVEVDGDSCKFVGEGGGVEILDGEVDPLAAPEDSVPETLPALELVGLEVEAVDREVLQMECLLRAVAVEAVIGQRESLHNGHHLLGQHTQATDRQRRLTVGFKHFEHIHRLPAQTLLTFGHGGLAIEGEKVEFVWQTVEREQEVLAFGTTCLEGFNLLAGERQVAFGHLVAVEEQQTSLALLYFYGFKMVKHI